MVYERGIIYKIVDSEEKEAYYGSTIQTLSTRMNEHRRDYKRWKKTGERRMVASYHMFETYGMEHCSIVLVEEYPCNSRGELHRREGEYIRSNECCNKQVAGRTLIEHYQDNKEKIREKHKEHYQKNREEALARNKRWREANKERMKELNKQWLEANRDKKNERERIRYKTKKEQVLQDRSLLPEIPNPSPSLPAIVFSSEPI